MLTKLKVRGGTTVFWPGWFLYAEPQNRIAIPINPNYNNRAGCFPQLARSLDRISRLYRSVI